VLPEPTAAVFISNAQRAVAMWGQRAARHDPVLWDYHVVVLLPVQRCIVDLDDRIQAVWPLDAWLTHAFAAGTPALHQPRFRIVPGDVYVATLSTDRRHMRDEHGAPRQPFPAWPAPFAAERGHNVFDFVALDRPFVGTVTDLAGLRALTS
jgi:hypothetical protein